VVVTEFVCGPFFGGVDAREVLEVESFFHELVAVYFDFAGRVEFTQDAPVFAQGIVDVADEACFIAVEFVVVGDSALIGAEFFIGPAGDLSIALEAGFYFRYSHYKC
jgi:hypothetical protein